jgi:hypothetical protein
VSCYASNGLINNLLPLAGRTWSFARMLLYAYDRLTIRLQSVRRLSLGVALCFLTACRLTCFSGRVYGSSEASVMCLTVW